MERIYREGVVAGEVSRMRDAEETLVHARIPNRFRIVP